MEDKVLWIALKLFLVWLFVMAFCLCICNCLFIRSDRRKTKAAKLAGQAALERHKKLNNKQYDDCHGDEEQLVGSSRAVIVPRKEKSSVIAAQQQPTTTATGQQPSSLSTLQLLKSLEQQQEQEHSQKSICSPQKHSRPQMTGQVPATSSSGSGGYVYRGVNPTFTFQHPSTDDVNASSPSLVQSSSSGKPKVKTICEKMEGKSKTVVDSNAKQSQKVSTELLLNLLTTPSGKYLLLGKEERFPRIETSSNPDLNVEKRLIPARVPFRANKRQIKAVDSLEETDSSTNSSNSSSSIHLSQTPAFVITEAEGLERPRSSSFSGTSSNRHPSPYRIRITTPSPSPSPSSFESERQSPLFGIIDSSGAGVGGVGIVVGAVTVDIGKDEPVETLEDYLTPSRLRHNGTTESDCGSSTTKPTVSDV